MPNTPDSESRGAQWYKKSCNNIIPRHPASSQQSSEKRSLHIETISVRIETIRIKITLRTEIVAPIRVEPCSKCGAPQVAEADVGKLRCPAFKCGDCDRLLKWFSQPKSGGAV